VKRRSLLKGGLVGGVLLATGGVGLGFWPSRRTYQPQAPLRVLDEREFAILAAIAARVVVVPGARPDTVAQRVDATLDMAPLEAQRDFKRLLLLFENAFFGLAFDGRPRPFTRLSTADQDAVLVAWRDSRITVRRAGYNVLRKALVAAYYAFPDSWAAVGYVGPPRIGGVP
jgi:hypothetical protein